jgi:hypothetical protein
MSMLFIAALDVQNQLKAAQRRVYKEMQAA